ncbi:hybrid sensor histidine kinase/response regulator [Xiamenia xianingshaonis]|uniref:histidine kinase n=2 Tax=Xiamenia xianingshaonis TaxID=2682776 RepID=A0ABX0IF88_9ACTN|nr:ATP-binding protein [Xiamenia xianingshaonis]NHM13444.1 response regulator [Xiamenia xianingshaonis]
MNAAKTKDEKQQNFRLITVLVLAILVVLAAVYAVACLVDDRLTESAEQQVITYTEQAAFTVSGQLALVQAAVDAFAVESGDAESVQPLLNAFCEAYGFSNAYFLDMDGSGCDAAGNPFSIENLPVIETALTRATYSFSDSYANANGQWVRMGQKPLFVKGVQVGALYVEVPMSLFTMPEELAIFGHGGYFILFEGRTGEVIGLPNQALKTPVAPGDSVFDFFERAQIADVEQADAAGSLFASLRIGETPAPSCYDEVRAWAADREVGAVGTVMDGVPCYVSVAPVPGSTWTACSVIPIASVRTEEPVINVMYGLVLLIVVFSLVAAGVLTYMLFQRRLRASHIAMEESLYAALSESIDMAVNLYCPADGTTTPIVAKASAILGHPLQAFMDDPRLARAVDLSSEGRLMLQHMREGSISQLNKGEFSLRSPETGLTRWVVYTVEPLSFDGKDQLMLVIQDVTTERTVRECMREAMDAADAASNAKSDFLSRMSHDIRTPMNVIIGMVQIAQNPSSDEAKMRVCLQKIGIASNQLLNLINEVLDFSKIESGKMVLASSPFSLRDIVDGVANVTRIQCEQKRLTFQLTCEYDGIAAFEGDAVRVEQMLTNLLTNAVKYTDEGGRVSLSVRVLPEKVAGYRPVEFVVADNGIGMSEEFQKNLFEPFSMEGRSRSQGTGLGMSIVKSVIVLMGGLITVDSKENVGSTFRVLVNIRVAPSSALPASPADDLAALRPVVLQPSEEAPAAKAEAPSPALPKRAGSASAAAALEGGAAAKPPADKAAARPGEGIHVLVVEDSELSADIACELLSMKGFTYDCARQGQEAVDKFCSAPEGTYDVILMDVHMPVVNGYEATRAIRASGRGDAESVVIVAMSANAFTDDVAASLESGMDAHLCKPMRIDNVVSVVIEQLALKG